jgi:hypothetical protein
MSVVPCIIKALKRKKTMEIIENTPEIPTSQHPVLTALNEKIATLEETITKLREDVTNADNRTREMRITKWNYEERVKNVLIGAYEDYDKDTVRHIASELDIALSLTKQVEVNVTFTIDLEYEIGEEPDPDWDFDFSVSHSDIIDYSSDVVYSKDV